MIFDSDKYKSGKHNLPNKEDRSIDKNGEEYNLQVAKYMYSLFCSGSTAISHDYYSTVSRHRKYALGLQDENIYRDMFYGKEDNTNSLEALANNGSSHKARRKGDANLNFSIQSPMPRVMDSIVNKLAELVSRVSVDATDKYSGAERENMKWGLFVEGKYRDRLNVIKSIAVLPQGEKGYTPRNVEELNLYEAEGGFKLTYEEVMERLLKYAFEQSLWEENTVELILRDLVTLGYAVVEDTYDKYTGQVKSRYVDAEYAGVQYTKQDANYNPDYGFYVDMVKISELKKKGIDETTILNLSKTYSNQFGNPTAEDWNKGNKTTTSVYYSSLDKWVVPVFVVKWKDVDHKSEKQYKNRQGKSRTKDVAHNYKYKKGEKEMYTRVKMNREVHWVISSDIVYDYGLCEFQARDGNNDPVLPIHMVQVSNRPIVPRLLPSLDQYMQGWMRMQHGLSMAVMDGYAIDMDSIANLKMDGNNMKPLEVLRLWRQTGTLFFKRTDVAGRPNGTQSSPIERLQGGAGAIMQEAMNLMDVAMSKIEELTGITPVSMGSTPNPEQGKAVTEYAIVGTNDILKGVLRKANILKSNNARAMCLRLNHVIGADKRAYNTYKEVVGESALEAIKIANGHDVTYGIRTHARSTQEEVQALKEAIGMSLKNGRDGKVGISDADYVRFIAMLDRGDSLKRITLLLDFANQKAQEEAEAKAARLQQENIQGTQMLEQQKAQQEQQRLAMETQAEIAKENVKGRNTLLSDAVTKGEMTAMDALAMIGIAQPPQAPQQQPRTQEVAPNEDRLIPAGQEGV